MKNHLALLAASYLAALTGCSTTVLIDPRAPLSSHSDTIVVADSRIVVVPKALAGKVEPKRYLGQTVKVVIALHSGSVAELVRSVVAAQIPVAKVNVTEFALTVDYGLWLATATAKITATITPAGKAAFEVRSSGLNNYYSPTPENFELAVNAALADLAEKLKSAQ